MAHSGPLGLIPAAISLCHSVGSHVCKALACVYLVLNSLIPPSIHKPQCIPEGDGDQIHDPLISSQLHYHWHNWYPLHLLPPPLDVLVNKIQLQLSFDLHNCLPT